MPIARVSRNPPPEALFVRIIIWATQKRAISWPRNHTRVFFWDRPFWLVSTAVLFHGLVRVFSVVMRIEPAPPLLLFKSHLFLHSGAA